MKNTKQKQKRKNKEQGLTQEELKKLLVKAGFVLVDRKRAFGKPEKDLHHGDTIIFPEGSTRGIPVR